MVPAVEDRRARLTGGRPVAGSRGRGNVRPGSLRTGPGRPRRADRRHRGSGAPEAPWSGSDGRRPRPAGVRGIRPDGGGLIAGQCRCGRRQHDRAGRRDGADRGERPGERDARDLGDEDGGENDRKQEPAGPGASRSHVLRIGSAAVRPGGPVVPPAGRRWCLLSQRSGWVGPGPVRTGSVAGSGRLDERGPDVVLEPRSPRSLAGHDVR